MKNNSGDSDFILHRTPERAKKYGEVFTPPDIVQLVCSSVEEYILDIYKTILEPACGNGNFLTHILNKRIQVSKSDREILIGLSNLYGIDILEDNIIETKTKMINIVKENIKDKKYIDIAGFIIDNNIIHGDFVLMKYANSDKSIIIYRYEISEEPISISFKTFELARAINKYNQTLF